MTPDEPSTAIEIKRQAIVIIHGVGEQRPLGTLKSFVRSFRPKDTFYSKPERLTSSFEARRMKLRKLGEGEDWIETDFYEYYWAHLMFGARWRHFVAWTHRVLARAWRAAGTSDDTHRSVHHPRVLSARKWMLISLGVVTAICVLLLTTSGLRVVAWIVLVVGLFFFFDWVFQSVLLRVVGDASRYLDVAPPNIARRHAILRGGIELLQSLHAARSDLTEGQHASAPYVYDRVVLVGHSLGSVIAYELIKHYWARVNRYLTVPEDRIPASLEMIEGSPTESESATATTVYQDRQFALWGELGRSRDTDSRAADAAVAPPRWLITDFVTLGSPLTYATVLLSESAEDLSEKTRVRELPTCPPNRSARDRPGKFAVHLWHEAAGHDNDPTLILHHAAPFALTRWTNFFFTSDPVGGPLRNVFGYGVRDVPVDPKQIGFDGPSGFLTGLRLHTRYWPQFPKAIPELLEILKWRNCP